LWRPGAFDDGTKQDISVTAVWNSSNPAIARVTSTGLLTSLGLGNADITATVGAVNRHHHHNRRREFGSKVSVVPVDTIASNTSSQMRAVAILKDGSSLDATIIPGITWSSSDSSVATVAASNGLVSAKGPGSATISAKLGSPSGSTTLNVADAAIQSLVVAPNQATMAPGTAQNLIALALSPTNQDSSSRTSAA